MKSDVTGVNKMNKMHNSPRTRRPSKSKETNTIKFDKDIDALMTACGIPEEFKELAWQLFCIGKRGE